MNNTKNPRGSGRLPNYFNLLDEDTTIEDDIIIHLESATGAVITQERAKAIASELTSKNTFALLAKYKAIIEDEIITQQAAERPTLKPGYDSSARKRRYAVAMEKKGKTVTHRVKKKVNEEKFDSLELFKDGVKVFEAERGADLIRYIENYGELTSKATMHRAIKYGSTINKKFTVKKKTDDTNN